MAFRLWDLNAWRTLVTRMSQMGQNRKCLRRRGMPVLPPTTDIGTPTALDPLELSENALRSERAKLIEAE